MNYNSYMTMTATHISMTETLDPDTGVRQKGGQTTIECFISGRHTLIRNTTGEATVSEQTVLTMAPVKVGDIINGHEVISVQQYNELDGTGTYYEALL